MRIFWILLFTTWLAIVFGLLTTPVQAADAGQLLAQLSSDLPGPSVEIDFSKGDWWVGLLFYLIMQWMRQRNGPRR